ncbi:MFS transporter [Steroidobacter cummioxidans]|uniref:MFS transporter n=1 Tax=Steroidobacter cummioxidans TaxID=1803913 RepID=UPI0019D4ACA2|nr:MFS transporter [Steroidobacter cummioxidans]
MSASSRRTTLLASLGGALEYYDFIIYGIFAAEIARAIFPASSSLVSLMASFGAFAVGYVARPLGGIVLSHFGDRFGRRKVFVISLLGMSGATLGMGLVPSYESWGLAAPMLMVFLRLLQGFCLGGELPGAITYVVEVAPKRAAFTSGFVFFCVMGGVVVATLLTLLIQNVMTPEQVATYGWRIPFWIGGGLGLLGFWVRRSLEESPEFERVKKQTSTSPFRELVRTHPRAVLIGIGLVACTAAFNGLLFAYMPAYLKTVLSVDPDKAIVAQNVALIVHSFALLATAWLGSRIAPRHLMTVGTLLFTLFSFAWYDAIVASGSNPWLPLVLGGVAAGLFNGSFAFLIADLFPTRIRFTGIALVLNVSMTCFSGAAPLAATALIRETGSLSAPAWFMTAAALIGLVSSLFVKRHGGQMDRDEQRDDEVPPATVSVPASAG